jgi:uncharacterized protein (TIGR03437 family)
MMKPMSRYLLYAVLAAAASTSLFAQPVVNDGGILNAASYMSSKLPGGAIAQGSIFVVFGARMGPAAIALAGFPLPSNLGGTSVRVSSGGQNLDCPLVYSLAGQLAAILPSNTPVGNATLTVSFGGQTSAPRSFRVVASSFGTFSLNQAGSGPGVITNFESATSQPVNTALRAARPGQTLILYGTGLGPLPAGTPDNGAAPAVAIGQANVELYVGGRRATVAYAGRAPGFAGLDQINFVVPTGALGCSIPVGIKIGNLVSNYTSIAIAPNGGTCEDPLGLSSSQLDRILSGGTVKLGSIGLSRADLEITVPFLGTQSIKTDTGVATFFEYSAQTINSGAQLGVSGVSSIGTCYVFVGTSNRLTPVDPIQPRGLNAGALINVNGPKGAKSLKQTTPSLIGTYSESFSTGGISFPGAPGGGDPDGYLVAGNYTFNNGGGGPDVGAFTANFTLPANVNWTNRASTSNVNRAQGLDVNWTGGDPNGYVQIYGYSLSEVAENAVTGFFSCLERASVGTFNVPSAILLALPPSPSGGANNLVPTGILGVGGVSSPRTFSAPGIDTGVIVSSSVVAKSVNYQ